MGDDDMLFSKHFQCKIIISLVILIDATILIKIKIIIIINGN